MKQACVFLAEGFEEVEALTPVDYLRRAGVEVTTLAIGSLRVTGSHGIEVAADLSVADAAGPAAGRDWDAVVVPGGQPGSSNIAASKEAIAIIMRQSARGGLVAAICAAPAVVLHGACGLLAGRRFTGYPGTEASVTGATFVPDRVVVDGNLITARAAGCAGEFSVAIVESLLGRDAAGELAGKVLLG
ncbi:MAG: DJ-1 family glyoxalase III [Spirochaetota bacterium]